MSILGKKANGLGGSFGPPSRTMADYEAVRQQMNYDQQVIAEAQKLSDAQRLMLAQARQQEIQYEVQRRQQQTLYEQEQREKDRRKVASSGVNRYFKEGQYPRCETCLFYMPRNIHSGLCFNAPSQKEANASATCMSHPQFQAVLDIIKQEQTVEYVKSRIGVTDKDG